MIQGEEQGMSVFNEALEWQDRAEQAREVAGRLTNPAARQAMLQAAKGYEYLARAAAHRAQRLQEPTIRAKERITELHDVICE
jgi:hypothetical protein